MSQLTEVMNSVRSVFEIVSRIDERIVGLREDIVDIKIRLDTAEKNFYEISTKVTKLELNDNKTEKIDFFLRDLNELKLKVERINGGQSGSRLDEIESDIKDFIKRISALETSGDGLLYHVRNYGNIVIQAIMAFLIGWLLFVVTSK